MPNNKNQHFVPRCYLKPFTYNGEGNAINLYNIRRELSIQDAPVKNQCSGDYFYGKSLVLEKELQEEENKYSQALKEIQLPGYRITDEHSDILRSF